MGKQQSEEILALQWDKLLRIKTTGRDDSMADQYRYPYEPTPYSVLERLAGSGYISKEMYFWTMDAGKVGWTSICLIRPGAAPWESSTTLACMNVRCLISRRQCPEGGLHLSLQMQSSTWFPLKWTGAIFQSIFCGNPAESDGADSGFLL